jgi:enoyl-[acyl-carrier protein] reductase I
MIDNSGKTFLVTGVGDNVGFAWHTSKKLQQSGANLIFAVHPRVEGIVNKFLTGKKYKDSRMLPDGTELSPLMVVPCDVSSCTGEASIETLKAEVVKSGHKIDGMLHAVAFSPEAKKPHFETSREAYLTAMSVSSYSLVALCNSLFELMTYEASVTALTYIASQKCIPFYGGGMASAKAALECDARALSWHLGEEKKVRINTVSPGPYASRAAKGIADIEAMADEVASRSPLRRKIDPEDTANAVLFLLSDLSKNITGETLYVDAGYHCSM